MWSHHAPAVRGFLRQNWLPSLFAVAVVIPLLWITDSLAARSGLLSLSGMPAPDELRVFLVFLGGSFATAATVFTTLIAREHNARESRRQAGENRREEYRQRLDTAVQSIHLIPADAAMARVAGVLTTLVLLDHERVALRVLGSAWDGEDVDDPTATWVIGQVLTGGDEVAAHEAAELLFQHAGQLTDEKRNRFAFPGDLMWHWRLPAGTSRAIKFRLLETMGAVLTSRRKNWWNPAGGPAAWPTVVLLDCAEHDADPAVRTSAAILVSAMHHCFPSDFRGILGDERLSSVLDSAAAGAADPSVPGSILTIADTIRGPWHTGANGAASNPGAWSLRRFIRR